MQFISPCDTIHANGGTVGLFREVDSSRHQHETPIFTVFWGVHRCLGQVVKNEQLLDPPPPKTKNLTDTEKFIFAYFWFLLFMFFLFFWKEGSKAQVTWP